ncbi:MAG: secretin N-terminal domain-containing protein [Rhodoferax sp.]|uniref:secretin N-terminal domain-containing protein n=1 Tax=Rhodoferax sp. TaxID=50421 RepID=UPI00301AF863
MKPVLLLTRKILPLTLALLLAGCAADRYRKEGLSLISEGRLEDGLAKLTLAQQTDSSDASIRKDWLMQREEITRRLMAEGNRERGAEHWDVALQRFNRVLSIDPGHIAAPQAITELTLARKQVLRLDEAAIKIQKGEFEPASALVGKVLIEAPSHPRALQLRTQLAEATQNDSFNGVSLNLKGRKPVTLQFREANLRMVMEAISKTTGLNVMFDKDVKSDLKVTIFVRDTPVEEAIDLILMQTQTTKRVMSENSILVYPDTETKGREYAELKIRRFSLTNADPKQVMAMVKAMVKTKDMFIDEKTNALIVRDTPQIIRLVEKLVATMDQPEPEVMLEVDVMEISRARALALGIDLPTSFGTSLTSMTVDQLKALGRNDFFSNAGVTITANKTDSDINDLATPRIRVRNKEKAKILVGDRLPVISSAATPSTTGAAPVYNTSVQYVEVGIKIEVEPTIYADGDVAIRLTLEVNSKGDQAPDVAKNGTIAYTIGTRSLSTVLRLKDGQTEVIGGLIQDQDRTGANRVPGFGDIPLLGRLFGKQTDTKNKSEIIMSITPHIVRNNRQADGDLLEMWSGTENNLRYGSKVVGASRTQLPTPSMPAAATPGAASPTASASRSGVARPAPALAAKAAGQATGTQITARPVALMPVVLSAPQAAKPGEQISVALALPALPAATQLDLTLAYDPATLRFVSVTEAGAERNAAVGARFTGDAEGAGSVHMELTAGRGESLPAGGGALAQVQFEVLTAAGPTQINISNATLHSADAGDQPLPMTPAVGVEIKAAP